MSYDVRYKPVNFVISAERVCQRNLDANFFGRKILKWCLRYRHFWVPVQGSKLTRANSQNASDFGNLRVRRISFSKLSKVRIIHVSQTFGESCSNARRNVRTTSEANNTAVAEFRRTRFSLATGQRYCTEALCHTFAFAFACFVVLHGFGAIVFIASDIRYGHWHFKKKEFASGLTSLLVEKILLAKLCKCTKKLTSSPAVYNSLCLGWFRICRDV